MKAAEARILADPEWTTQDHICVSTIILGFAVGVMQADPWHKHYSLPPNFETVVNFVAEAAGRTGAFVALVDVCAPCHEAATGDASSGPERGR
jgi:hypothetical protein